LEDRRAKSGRRAARNVADIVRASSLDHLLTLSAGKHFRSHLEALDAWSSYLDDSRYGRWFREVIGGKYVAVAESYSDGDGWHIHAALAGYLRPPHLMRLKITWTAFLHHRIGIGRPDTEKRLWRVHIAAPGRGRSPRNLGKYLGKYIAKGLVDLPLGTRRYRCGLGLLRPRLVRTIHYLSDWEAKSLFMECGRYFDVKMADGTHIGWCGEYQPPSHSPPVP